MKLKKSKLPKYYIRISWMFHEGVKEEMGMR